MRCFGCTKTTRFLPHLFILYPNIEAHITEILCFLRNGQAINALIYSDVMIETKNVSILEELQQYILKHQDEICNYGYRKATGKIIGSGKGKKANDQLVAHRQKKKSDCRCGAKLVSKGKWSFDCP